MSMDTEGHKLQDVSPIHLSESLPHLCPDIEIRSRAAVTAPNVAHYALLGHVQMRGADCILSVLVGQARLSTIPRQLAVKASSSPWENHEQVASQKARRD